MLKIRKLYVNIKNKIILKNINLNIKKREIHILMGPNGSGKSTLSYVITRKPNYNIVKGDIILNNKIINKLSPDKISKLGIFLSFQNPIEIEGINMLKYLKYLNNNITYKKIKEYCNLLNIDINKLSRFFNSGFSGGEKKKNEILQLLILKPKLIILDEIDSGLDIDTINIIFRILNNYFLKKKCSIIIITHNTNIVKYINPNKVHIINKGKITFTGNKEVINKIVKYGYNNYK
ncbi:MAG: Fe-S cluster assembly ATPase SufC [Candidatus Shikimatogenerans bostrichidophilus]|nr:MAG: Fe-S cluster assembly ATPase SufC [Candidatus Shikimatogenerans bostrichidophilus]